MAMIVLGITGGIGMGKSVAEALLRERGVPVVDTDALARELVAPGQPALLEIIHSFGREFLDPQGGLRREALAAVVFAEPAARARLEAILHPRIRAQWLAEVDRWRAQGTPLGAVVIPLLFETGAEPSFDAVVCVACTAAAQEQRLSARGWTPDEIERRNAAQWPVERKLKSAHYVIWTEGDMELHRRQWDCLLAGVENRP